MTLFLERPLSLKRRNHTVSAFIHVYSFTEIKMEKIDVFFMYEEEIRSDYFVY